MVMATTPLPASHPALPWWSSPAGLALGFQLPVLLLVAWSGSLGTSASLTIRGVRFLDASYLLLA